MGGFLEAGTEEKGKVMGSYVQSLKDSNDYRVRYVEGGPAIVQAQHGGRWIPWTQLDPSEVEEWVSSRDGRIVATAQGRGQFKTEEKTDGV